MVETRWFRRAGPGIAALGGVALIAATSLGAGDRPWTPPPCPGVATGPQASERASGTAWLRQDAVLADGTLRGQRLAIGRADDARPRTIELAVESFAAGPFGDTVLVGTDDGTASRLSLVDLGRACVWTIATSDAVIRRATLAPDGRTIYEMRVERTSRADLGIWRRSLDGTGAPVRVLGPIAADARFGRTFATEFTWSPDGQRLAVGSCGEVACRVRVLDPATGSHRLVADPSLGAVVGVTTDHVVTHGACRGLPCPVVSVALGDGTRTVLHEEAGLATLTTAMDGSPSVVMEVGPGGLELRVVGTDGRGARDLGRAPEGRRLVVPSATAGSATVPAGWLTFGPGGRLALDGPTPALFRHITDGPTVRLDEVPR